VGIFYSTIHRRQHAQPYTSGTKEEAEEREERETEISAVFREWFRKENYRLSR